MPGTKLSQNTIHSFQAIILNHYKKNHRFFSWRTTTNPYHILVSEIMLQQTQTDRVVEKYQLFIKTFPSFASLAKAPLKKVLHIWQGLGYNRRAIQLKKTADIVTRLYGGKLPNDPHVLKTFPGIGPHTAGSICAFAFNLPVAFIETNIRTVFIHHFGEVDDKDIFPLVEQTLDRKNPRQWYNALMDYGAFLKKQFKNPSRKSAQYAKQSPFKGSNREIRGAILRVLTRQSLTAKQLITMLNKDRERIIKNLGDLEKEGFILEKSGKWFIP